ncbi:hypothetical protein, partial [Staphylococcus aureus]|uniref:hypothetical protein n=2 Tax=Staphylococcus aureus TaxID=1280 RepID=UPI001F361A7B
SNPYLRLHCTSFETIVAAIPARFPFIPILANFFATPFKFLALTSSKTAVIMFPVKSSPYEFKTSE